jgi:hypothetical protein
MCALRALIPKCDSGVPRDVELVTLWGNREGSVGHTHRGVFTKVVGEIRLHVENIRRLEAVLARRGDRSVEAATVTREAGGDPEVLVRQARDNVTDGRGVLDVASRDNDSRIGLHVFPLCNEDFANRIPLCWGLIQCTTGFDPHKSCGAIFLKDSCRCSGHGTWGTLPESRR